jgi:hypothetical protein
MSKVIDNVLSKDIINDLLGLSEVKAAKKKIDRQTSGSVYFTIHLTDYVKILLHKKLGLDFFTKEDIPMRWVKGDTLPHIDRGASTFENTYLVYLTDSPGELILENERYSITQGSGYVFSEGIHHETMGTGSEPRLLLGPMSEEGFAVGAATIIVANGQTDTIYFKQTGFSVEYKINDGSYSGFSLPVTILNIDTSFTLKVLFENTMTFSSDIWYFICGSDNIQFGSTSLNLDGTRSIINIDSVLNYPGLIQNTNLHDNIYIYNLEVHSTGGSTLQTNGGWIGQENFAKGASNNYIINCSSDGEIIDAGGGIVGGNAASDSGNLQIINCSSSGNSAVYSGGIVGYYAGINSGQVICNQCWSTGSIGQNGGGIFGYGAGDTLGTANALNCYSTGSISDGGGGIFGQLSGNNSGNATAQNCYSTGLIGTDAGGIFGKFAASAFGTTIAQNCYSTGIVTTSGNGIYGTAPGGGVTQTNCYAANGTWNTSTANANLSGVPTSPNSVGTDWVETIVNDPYELLHMGYVPYVTEIILVNAGTPSLLTNISSFVLAGESSPPAIVSGKSYTILQISGGSSSSYGTITIDSTTGVISTTTSTTPGIYTLYLRNTGSYNITMVVLEITSGAVSNVSCCLLPSDLPNFSYRYRNEIIQGNTLLYDTPNNNKFVDYSFYYYKRMAAASKH